MCGLFLIVGTVPLAAAIDITRHISGIRYLFIALSSIPLAIVTGNTLKSSRITDYNKHLMKKYTTSKWKSVNNTSLHEAMTTESFITSEHTNDGFSNITTWNWLGDIVHNYTDYVSDEFHQWASTQLNNDPFTCIYYIASED